MGCCSALYRKGEIQLISLISFSSSWRWFRPCWNSALLEANAYVKEKLHSSWGPREDTTVSTCLFHLSKCPHSHSSFLLQPANKCPQMKYHRHTDHKRPPSARTCSHLLKLPCLQLLTYKSEKRNKKDWNCCFPFFSLLLQVPEFSDPPFKVPTITSL